MNKSAQPLSGLRVLIVEDRYLIATEVAEEVGRLGAEVVGPVRDAAAAAALVAREPVNVAVLDVKLLEGEPVYPLAEQLIARGVPFIFLTGYDRETLPDRWRDSPWLTKPLNPAALRQALENLKR